MKDRIFYLDNLKVLAIFLVVLGHCIQYSIIDFDNNPLFCFIYSFHMPLFFLISGYFSYKEYFKFTEVIKKRFMQLLLPYFVWGILKIIINGENIIDIVCRVDNYLWFLWTLFFLYLITVTIKKLIPRFAVFLSTVMLIYLILFVTVLLSDSNIFGMKLICTNFPYFFIGYVSSKYKMAARLHSKNLFWSLPLFLILVFYWKRSDIVLFFNHLNSYETFIYKFVTAICGVVTFMLIFKTHFNKKIAIMTDLSTLTLGIYAIHYYLIYAILPYKIHYTILAFITFIVTALIVKCMLKCRILKFLIGG